MTILAILYTEISAAENEVAPSYHRLLGLYFLAVIFAATTLLNFYRSVVSSILFRIDFSITRRLLNSYSHSYYYSSSIRNSSSVQNAKI